MLQLALTRAVDLSICCNRSQYLFHELVLIGTRVSADWKISQWILENQLQIKWQKLQIKQTKIEVNKRTINIK